MGESPTWASGQWGRAALVVGAGIVAGLHVAKLPPAIPILQLELGLSLVQAGFLLAGTQIAGMLCGVAFGTAVDGLGHRRSLLAGLCVLALCSAMATLAHSAALMLMLRAVEGCGFLLVVLAAPALLRQIVPPARLQAVLGVWGAYVPIATAAAFLAGPFVLAAAGWRAWWGGLGLLTLLMALAAVRIPSPGPVTASSGSEASPGGGMLMRLRLTLGSAGPWCVALTFGFYAAQWLAVVGFLPAVYTAAGWSPAGVAWASAVAAGVNALGNIAAGRLLQRGVRPSSLLRVGFVAMALGAIGAYAEFGGTGLPPWARILAVMVFSVVGGLIPGTLFTLAVRLAPQPQAVGTTLGWVQQLAATGQFCGPPLVAWVAAGAGGWRMTGWVTAALAAAGLVLVQLLSHLDDRARQRNATAAVSPSAFEPSSPRPS